MPAAPWTPPPSASTHRVPSWTVTVRPHDTEPWVVALVGPITSTSTELLVEMAEWVGDELSVDTVVFDLWGADVKPNAGGIDALLAAAVAVAQRGVHVQIRGAEPCWQAQLAPLVPLGSCRFEESSAAVLVGSSPG